MPTRKEKEQYIECSLPSNRAYRKEILKFLDDVTGQGPSLQSGALVKSVDWYQKGSNGFLALFENGEGMKIMNSQ